MTARDGLNREQRRVAETFGRPIAAMAGAGSGKTFTMVRRILNAFDPAVVGDPRLVVEDIDQVLAITFTEKAAEELKSRVRAGLKSIRRPDQAHKVDAAWIGTIHGMCSRILRENALELGLDPSFAILAEDDRSALLDEVTERVLLDDGAETAADVRELLGEYRRANLKRTISRLVDRASQSLRGFDSLDTCPVDGLLAQEGQGLPIGCAVDLEEVVEAHLRESVGKRARANALDAFKGNLPIYARYARFWEPLVRVARAVDRMFWERKRALGVLDQGDLLVRTVRALGEPAIGGPYAERFRLVINDEFQDTDCLQFEIIRRLSGEGMERLCVVGDVKQSIYRFRGADLSLSEGFVAGLRAADEATGRSSVFDLRTNYRSAKAVLDFVNLVFDARPDLPNEPRLPFGYDAIVPGRRETGDPAEFGDAAHGGPRIEVAELQYTNGRKRAATELAAAHVARRFREIHERTGRRYGEMVVLLNTMTAAPLFAEALDAEGIPNAITGGSVFARRPVPNVLLDLVRLLANPHDGEAVAVALSSDLFGFEPEDFRELVDISGKACKADEALPIGAALADLLADPKGCSVDTGIPGGSRTTAAMGALSRAVALIGRVPPSRILRNVLVDSGWLVRQASGEGVVPSARTDDDGEDVGGAHGMAAVADALKFIRMAEDLEAEGCLGFRDLALRLERRLAESKEAPGFLATEANDFVRIMTIHASKGLEFPVVAVSGLERGQSRLLEGRCALVGASRRSVDEKTGEARYDLATYGLTFPDRSAYDLEKGVVERLNYGGSPAGNALDAIRDCACERQARLVGIWDRATTGEIVDLVGQEAFDELMDRARAHGDPGLWYAAMKLYEEDADRAELMRKAYVAYTRAREALIVCLPVPVSLDAYRPLVNELKGVGPKEKLDEVEALYSFLPDVHPVSERNEVAARIQRRRGAIAALGAYRLVPFSRVNLWRDFGIWPPELGGEDDGAESGFPLVAEAPERDADDNRLEDLPSVRIPEAFVERPPTNLSYKGRSADGILSASSLEKGRQSEVQESRDDGDPDVEERDGDGSQAKEKGIAFHAVCQLAVQGWERGACLTPPEGERVEAILHRYHLRDDARAEVLEALETWFRSDIAKDLSTYGRLDAEVPFFVPLAEAGAKGGPLYLTGFIDLLGRGAPDGGAPWIVDYKTGISDHDREHWRKTYRTQAMVYAYALMLQGHSRPKVTFVLVEHVEGGQPATCEFPADGEDWNLEGLRSELIAMARGTS